ncbi:MAG: hypothetical protein WC264_02025 [Candidatus Paceibacterota bacterium]|jgi:hypothetical protein
MKVCKLRTKIVKGKLIFKIEEPVQEKSIDELDKKGEFTEALKRLYIQRWIIRQSKKVRRKDIEKMFENFRLRPATPK